jgi:hypothetical protein
MGRGQNAITSALRSRKFRTALGHVGCGVLDHLTVIGNDRGCPVTRSTERSAKLASDTVGQLLLACGLEPSSNVGQESLEFADPLVQ